MSLALLAALALPGDSRPKVDPDQYPLALHRSMEVDDLDREIQRLHDTVLMKRAGLSASQRLATRGLVSPGELERETADVRYHEARESETLAYRALKVYERDVMGHAIEADENKAYSLLLDWVRKQLAIAQVDADHRAYQLKQTRALFGRKAVSRQELEESELGNNAAQAGVALSRSREAQVLMELAARAGEKPYDPAEYHRLKGVYLAARVHFYEITAEGARRRLEIARERSRKGLIPSAELAIFERADRDAGASLAQERQALDRHDADPPAATPKTRASRNPARDT